MGPSAKPKRKPLSALAIFDHAYRIVGAELEMRETKNPRDRQGLGQATMILSVFGLELLLKSLIVLDNKIPKPTHSLSALFRQLNHKHKRLIESRWDLEGRPRITPFAKAQGLPTDLANAIVACEKAFERMRYIYEYEDGAVYYLQGLPPLVVNVILNEIKPEWLSPHPLLSTFPIRGQ